LTDERHQPGTDIPPLHTDLPALDRLVQGFKPGDLVVVASRPGMGKSALVGQWLEVWSRQGLPCLFCSLAMPAQEVLDRMVDGEANVSLPDVQRRSSPHLGAVLDLIVRWPLLLDDEGRGAHVRFSEFSGEWPIGSGATVRPIRRGFNG
jgi:replicative DNA helicase